LRGICGWNGRVEPGWDAGSQESGVDQVFYIAVGDAGAACGNRDAGLEDSKGALRDVVGDELAGSRGEFGPVTPSTLSD
jgi:hypothetical protein